MKRIFLLLFIIHFQTFAFSEYLFYNDGSIKKCIVIKDRPNELTVRFEDGSIVTVVRKSLLRIQYTEFYKGKVHIKKNNGTILEGYIVDEDRLSYTFRKELYKPMEFKLTRKEVLFFAKTNPTELKGEVKGNIIKLQWFKPYVPIKHYNIYVSEKSDKDFKKIGETSNTHYEIKNLIINIPYYCRITSVDRKGDESLPGNMINFVAQRALFPPHKIKLKKKVSTKQNNIDLELSWDAVRENGKNVKNYSVYIKKDLSFEKIGNTKGIETSYTIKDLKPDDIYRIVFYIFTIFSYSIP